MSAFFSLGLIGYPLEHSVSPVLHSVALDSVNVEGHYGLLPIEPDHNGEKLATVLDSVRDGRIRGLNVTIPHKKTVIPFLDQLTPIAEQVGAVNTIYLENGKLVGHNTDAEGFLTDLRKHFRMNSSCALVLGAGGSAHAVVAALLSDQWDVIIAARRTQQAENLAIHMDSKFPDLPGTVQCVNFNPEGLADATRDCNLVVNTTPLGMYPGVHSSPWPRNARFSPEIFIYDLVYNPPETEFVQFGRACGARGVTGLGMLVEQAALSFQIWVGLSPDRQKMYSAASELLS